jgi:hypothetical protein
MDENIETARGLLSLADGASLNDAHALASSAALRAQAYTLIDIAESLRKLTAQLERPEVTGTAAPLWTAEDEQPPVPWARPRAEDELPF